MLNIVNDLDDENSYHISNSCCYTDTEVYTMIQNTQTFTVLSLNTQSLPAKFTDITLFIDELRTHNCYVDVINFQETWITDNTYFADFNISGYTMYVQPATCSTHSGLITYIKTYLQSTKLIDFTHQNPQTWEGMFIEIENLNKTVIIGNIYRPPRESNHEISQFIDELNITIQNRKLRNKNFILSGDFNINLLKLNEKQVYANYFDMLTTNSLLPNITHPTRITRTSATLIDNIFSNTLGDNVKSGIITNRLISDHQIIFSCFENIINFHKPKVTKYYYYYSFYYYRLLLLLFYYYYYSFYYYILL